MEVRRGINCENGRVALKGIPQRSRDCFALTQVTWLPFLQKPEAPTPSPTWLAIACDQGGQGTGEDSAACLALLSPQTSRVAEYHLPKPETTTAKVGAWQHPSQAVLRLLPAKPGRCSHLVERALSGKVAVVAEHEVDAVIQASGLDACRGLCQLLF
eukprot:362200-Chlamydomonas_euryale.AAC.7